VPLRPRLRQGEPRHDARDRRGIDALCTSIATALLAFPERLGPVRDQGARTQERVEADGFDPVLATMVRLAVSRLRLS
jgi:hypothetical protein